jgi:hypothetical protein
VKPGPRGGGRRTDPTERISTVTDTRRKAYDKELIRERTLDVLTHYLRAPGKDQGSRVVWNCPSCGKAEKFAVKKAERKGGCLVAGCSLEGYEDVFSLVARFEDLDYRTDFLLVLEKAHEALGLNPDCARARTKKRPSNGKPPRGEPDAARTASLKERRGRYARGLSEASGGARAARAPEGEEVRELAARAYGRIMELCPLESRDRSYLRKRGLSYETIKRGRFGTMTAARAREVKAALQRELGREALLSVPGFSEDGETGRLKFTLAGDYLLIPYHDAEGRITTIEGRATGKVPEGMGKYVSLRRAGNHLYVFPDHDPGALLAVCEGVMGAVVAAEAGLPVGAIQGCERYRASLSTDFPDGEPDEPLLELKGADFGGRLLPYIPDADDPPNPGVLRAAPKAARWLAEPHNARPAICLLPDGTDLDEWLLSLRPDERRQRFEELLRTAVPPEDGAVSPLGTAGKASAPNRRKLAKDRADDDRRLGERHPSNKTAPVPSEERTSLPGEERHGSTRRASAGARRLRDEVYRALLEALPLKEAHLEALSRRGVMRETTRVGGLGSVDEKRADRVAARLVKSFGVRRLLSVPGFQRASSESVRLTLRGEYLLLPCFDGEGLLSAVEALPLDGDTGEISDEETVPLPGAGDHLYVFAAYRPGEVEGFCEGPLGALLAAQEDVVVGAIGGFRRHGSGAGLPELDGVDLSGRELAYVPRAGSGEENARYHEAELAARSLVERQGGRPLVAGVRDAGREDGPTSLAEWLLSLSEYETHQRLRELFPEGPRRRTRTDTGGEGGHDEHVETEDDGATPVRIAAIPAAVGAVVAFAIYLGLLRLRAFSESVGVGSAGKPMPEGGSPGALRALTGSPPFELLYAAPVASAWVAGIGAALFLWWKARTAYAGRRVAERVRLAGRWELHETPRKEPPSVVPITLPEAVLTVLAWPVAYFASSWLMETVERLLALAADLGMVPATGTLVADPTNACAAMATLVAAFVLWRRRAIRVGKARMLLGKIEH